MRTPPGPRTPAWLMLLGAALLVVLIVWAVGGWADYTTERGFTTGEPITVEGCLTAGAEANAFVLTPVGLNPLGTALSGSAEEVRTTFTYELIGDPSQLRPHAGRIVNVTGIVAEDVERETELDREQTTAPRVPESAEMEPPDEAVVETTQEAEIQVRRMEVQSVEPTGQSCPVGGGRDEPAGTDAPQEP